MFSFLFLFSSYSALVLPIAVRSQSERKEKKKGKFDSFFGAPSTTNSQHMRYIKFIRRIFIGIWCVAVGNMIIWSLASPAVLRIAPDLYAFIWKLLCYTFICLTLMTLPILRIYLHLRHLPGSHITSGALRREIRTLQQTGRRRDTLDRLQQEVQAASPFAPRIWARLYRGRLGEPMNPELTEELARAARQGSGNRWRFWQDMFWG